MHESFLRTIVFLLAGIAVIVLLTAKFKVPAFFALLIACFVTGLGVQMPAPDILNSIKDGFGATMRSLALIIVMGTTLGVILERTGSTQTMANAILKVVGEKKAAWAVSITGFIVGLPIFCDSGFIVLSGLNKSLVRKTGISNAYMSVSLATGLLAVHCLVPPHPGVSAAAATIGVDVGRLLLYGILIAIPAMIVGHIWAGYAGRKHVMPTGENGEKMEERSHKLPNTLMAFLPVIVPILLISAKSLLSSSGLIAILGDPFIALSVGVLIALFNKNWSRLEVSHLLQDAVEKAGGILVIIGAGGAFGAVLASAHTGELFSQTVSVGSWGILFPFLLAFLLKTAQGSSTVAIITAASIVMPLLPALHLDTQNGKMIAVLAMGAGSMMISHANDAYFWVITKFSGLGIKTTFRVYTIASILMGITSLAAVYLLSILLS